MYSSPREMEQTGLKFMLHFARRDGDLPSVIHKLLLSLQRHLSWESKEVGGK